MIAATGTYLPTGFSFLWQPSLLWLHVISDGAIALAYLSIPTILAVHLWRRHDTPYLWVFAAFGVFVALGGLTHVLAIVDVWTPLYWLDGIVKAAAAVVSIVAAAMLAPVLPKLIKIQNPIVDGLTSLPNRLLFLDRVGQAIARLRKENREQLAVLFVDIDGFKRVNDSLGHDLGNQLLIRVGKRLDRALRTGIDTVARFGGDEFIILLERIEGPLYAKSVARRLISELERPFPFGEVSVQISGSIGIVISDGSEPPEELISAADTAMYRAKQTQRGTFEVYDKTWRGAEAVAH